MSWSVGVGVGIDEGVGQEAAQRLRSRRAVIARVLDELGGVLHSGLPDDSGQWQSAAQKRYASRLAELRALLAQSHRQLEAARETVDRAIANAGPGG